MKKLLVILPSFDIGGAQKIGSFVANIASKNGYVVSVIGLKDGKSNLKFNNDIDLYTMNKNFKKFRFQQIIHRFSVSIKLKRNIKELKPDTILVFGTMTEAIIALRNVSIPIISTERGFPNQYPEYLKKMINHLFKKSELVIFQTPMAREYYKIPIKDSIIIPNPIFFKDEKLSRSKNTGNCITVGRLVKEKGYHYLITAFSNVHKEFPNEKLEIYGDGEERVVLQKLIDDLGANDYIKLMGKTNHVREKLSIAKMFILSSEFEGIPNTLLEAMSLGLPIVTTDCLPGGANFLTKNGSVGGPLVSYGSAQKLEESIKNLLQNWDEAILKGLAGKYVNEEFSTERIGNIWLEAINKVSQKH